MVQQGQYFLVHAMVALWDCCRVGRIWWQGCNATSMVLLAIEGASI